ncbi:HNH endonuclease [Mesorhizobium australicum]|uniref:HNH endonuclease n=1 Tax=Mesorhizobium australicum TaxID=536018 RepID=UPI00333D32F1
MPELTRAAVEAAINEYDEKTRKAFLDEYGFKGARDYFLVVNGKNYDSKAIVAVAHKFLETGRPLTHDELVGGKNDAAKKLIDLGFQVTTPGENPDWTWDEHVLALDLYFQLKGTAFSKIHPKVLALSELLRTTGGFVGSAASTKFRNANGVNMKLMNFRRLDPDMQAAGLVGLTRGSRGEVEVWNRYVDDRSALAAAVGIIRSGASPGPTFVDSDQDESSAEGSVVLRLHKKRERDSGLAHRKRAAVLAAHGKLACEVCDMTFGARYGEHGQDFIEVHHNDPIALSQPGRRTSLDELACVCSNCHRMLHRNGLREISWLRQQLRLP